jgi:heme oxygenase
MISGNLQIEYYTLLLSDMYHIYDIWETEGQSILQSIGKPWPKSSSRRAAILRDLKFWQRELTQIPTVIEQWKTQLSTQKQSLCWAGAGYVLEGSRLGSHYIGRQLARTWGCPASVGYGLDFHLEDTEHLAQYWPLVMQYLEDLGSCPEYRHVMISAAVNTFRLLYDLYARYCTEPNPTDEALAVTQEVSP